jgi:hypothetical protein
MVCSQALAHQMPWRTRSHVHASLLYGHRNRYPPRLRITARHMTPQLPHPPPLPVPPSLPISDCARLISRATMSLMPVSLADRAGRWASQPPYLRASLWTAPMRPRFCSPATASRDGPTHTPGCGRCSEKRLPRLWRRSRRPLGLRDSGDRSARWQAV